ncbi:MAG TPA: hypothetical protein VI316_10805 [Candidatus Dormibacteraeota bacterium]
METLVWSIAHGARHATVGEDGSLEGDPELVELLRRHLAEPVTVYRRGTVPSPDVDAADAIKLRPGDGRYVVARIRVLCADDPGYEIVGCGWKPTG